MTVRTKTFVIVNPSSAGGATMKRWPRASEKLEKVIGAFDYDFTNAAGVATILAGAAVKEGYSTIISVGGDGTLHEIVQGLFDDGKLINPDIVVGMLPFGSGTDFPRTLKMSNDPDEAIVRLRGERTKKVDVGLARFRDHQGNSSERYFINMADVGLGGEVADRANNSTKVFGGFGAYLFSTVISFASYKPKRVRINAGNNTLDQEVTSVFVANGKYYGGGMWIAPAAEIDDGYFDVIVVQKLSRWDVVALAPRLYSGRLGTMPGVKHFRARDISIESDEAVLISLDGEQPGTTPVSFGLIPRALNFKV